LDNTIQPVEKDQDGPEVEY